MSQAGCWHVDCKLQTNDNQKPTPNIVDSGLRLGVNRNSRSPQSAYCQPLTVDNQQPITNNRATMNSMRLWIWVFVIASAILAIGGWSNFYPLRTTQPPGIAQAKIACPKCKKLNVRTAKVCAFCKAKLPVATTAPKTNYPAVARLTKERASDSQPAWSPDGKIAFSSDRDRGYEIYVMNADGTNVKKIQTKDVINAHMPCWTPDGKIVFIGDTGSNLHIFVIDADGTNQKQLSAFSSSHLNPAVGPDGRIAFAADLDQLLDIHVMSANGYTDRTNFVTVGYHRAKDLQPTWGPGGKIAFVSERDGIERDEKQIFVVDADGTTVTRLTSGPKWNNEPSWGPDGRILFTSYRDGQAEIYIMNGDGSNQKRLTNNEGNDMYPRWGPNGMIAFYSTREDEGDIYTMKAPPK